MCHLNKRPIAIARAAPKVSPAMMNIPQSCPAISFQSSETAFGVCNASYVIQNPPLIENNTKLTIKNQSCAKN